MWELWWSMVLSFLLECTYIFFILVALDMNSFILSKKLLYYGLWVICFLNVCTVSRRQTTFEFFIVWVKQYCICVIFSNFKIFFFQTIKIPFSGLIHNFVNLLIKVCNTLLCIFCNYVEQNCLWVSKLYYYMYFYSIDLS